MDNWQGVAGRLAQIGLPGLGGLIGGLVFPGLGTAAGASAGRLAASAVAAALGVAPEPKAITAAIEADPAGAQLKLAQIEADSKAHAGELADIADARATMVSLAQAASPIAWGAPVVSFVVTVGFFGVMGLLFFVRSEMPQSVFQLLSVMLGILATAFSAVVQYWTGSSDSSRRNGDAIREVARSAIAPAGVPASSGTVRATKR